MSPNVGNFVHDLVEMAKAMEALPGIQAELAQAHADIETYAATIQRLELRLMERSAEIDALHSKVREAEAARDSAETMFLECDDKLSAFRRLVKSFASDATTLALAQEPVVEPVKETDAIHGGQSEAAPTAEPSAGQSDVLSAPVESLDVTSTGLVAGGGSGGAPAVGESVSHPTSANASAIEEQTHSNVHTSTAEPQTSAATPDTNPGVSVSLSPTSAPSTPTTIGPEPTGSAYEPEKYEPGTRIVTRAWWDWYDNQTADFRASYDWSKH